MIRAVSCALLLAGCYNLDSFSRNAKDAAENDGSTNDGAANAGPRHLFLYGPRNGGLGGLMGADALCNENRGTLTGQYRAILSVAGVANAKDRITLTNTDRAIVLPSGTKVATDQTLFQGGLINPINESASGATQPNMLMWTNTEPSGKSSSSHHCDGWTNSTNLRDGDYGSNLEVDGRWVQSGGAANCDFVGYLYCIEQ